MTHGTSLTPPPPERFPSAFAQPDQRTGASIPAVRDVTALPATATPMPSRKGRSASIWILGALAVVLVAMAGYFLEALGGAASLLGMVVALVPLTIVLVAVRLIDRWEPEPASLILLAVAWGAIAAVGLALLVDLGLGRVLVESDARNLLRTIVQAPIVEELGKGVGVLLIYLTARRAFDGPVDGVVYGALIGAGFAFTENIQYFAVSFLEGGAETLTATFFVRGILSPFAHAMFTSLIGFALGLAARRGASAGAAIGPWLLGVLGAMILHGLWNGSAMLGDFYQLYVVLQVPLFVAFILGVIALRREEARLTRQRLGDYAAAGWFTTEEVDMLATPGGRRTGLAWAATLRGDRSALMKSFIRDATALAAARQRAISGRDAGAAEDEHILLTRTAATRQSLLSI